MIGEAREAGRRFGQRIVSLAKRVEEPTLVVAGGETTVTVRGAGQGGRNQEFALAAAQAIADVDEVQIAAHATDGTDGTTSAAGAVVDGETIRRGAALGLDSGRALENNDSRAFLAATGDLLWTGPTGTNVADVILGLIGVR
jgi:glycerate-2-kinase